MARPKGIGREGKYGTGVKTKVVRIPEDMNLEEILEQHEQIKAIAGSWEKSINTNSPRYDQAKILLQEIREALKPEI